MASIMACDSATSLPMNEQKFDAENKVEQWGILEEGRAIIYNQAFKDLCKNGGFSDKAFLSWADRKDLIETQGGRMTKVKKVGGNPVRCVFLKLNENLDEDGFESVETMEMYEQEELPLQSLLLPDFQSEKVDFGIPVSFATL